MDRKPLAPPPESQVGIIAALLVHYKAPTLCTPIPAHVCCASTKPVGIWDEAKARVQQKKLVVSFTFPRALAPSSAAAGLKEVCFVLLPASRPAGLPACLLARLSI